MTPAGYVRGSAWSLCENRKASRLSLDRNLPLPVLEITAPARPDHELPDLSESWAWAHAQIAGSQRDAGSLKQSLAGDPALTVSRLLCPRRLDPLTDYLACVVPAFMLGCKAGLGLPIEPADEQPPLGLAPAWVVGRTSSHTSDLAGLFSLGVSHRRRRRFRSAGAIARGAQDAAGSRQTADGHQPAWVHHHPAAATRHDARARRRVARPERPNCRVAG